MPARPMSANRLEAFSDGVIAVVITIMVLELHVPAENGPHGLLHLLPRLGLYALSFLLTGIYWVNHHELLRRTEIVDYRVLWSNLIFLFTLSLIPFFTDYAGEKHYDSFSTALYAVANLLAAVGYLILRIAVDRIRVEQGQIIERTNRMEAVKHIVCLALDLIAVPLAYKSPLASFLILCFVALVWTAPELGIQRPATCHASLPAID